MGFSDRHYRRIAGLLPVVAVLAAALVAGCVLVGGPPPPAYQVVRGDTLFSIAQHYNLDWRQVARWNGIGPPYTLAPGETLRLRPGTVVGSRRDRRQQRPPSRTTTASRSPPPAKPPPARSPAPPPPAKPPPARSPVPPPTAKHHRWQWPATGPVVDDYAASKPRQGIDIGGKVGDPVRAADGGRVVYSGSGLKGYGKLLIIKHDQHYLTAYGFNRRLLVGQGATVKAGQQIAEMGKGPGKKPILHFEIRRNGQPLDPIQVLPHR